MARNASSSPKRSVTRAVFELSRFDLGNYDAGLMSIHLIKGFLG